MTNSITMLLISINKTKGHSLYNGPSSFEELNKFRNREKRELQRKIVVRVCV